MNKSNPVLAWSSIKDSAGALVNQYALHLSTPMLKPTSVAYGFFTELFYMGFLVLSTVSAELLKAVSDPNRWIDPLQRLFSSVTDPIYAVIPPTYIAVAAFGIMVVLLLVPKTNTMSARFGAEEFQRMAVGIAIVALIVMWMMNPFALLGKILNGILQVVNDIIPGAARGSQLDTLSADTMIRPATILINYGTRLSDECVTAWSHLQDGSDVTSFYSMNCASKDADTPTMVTLAVAFVVCIVAIMFFVFAVMSAWKFFSHIIMCGLITFAMVYVLAASILKRRAFDFPARVAASGIGHFVISVIVMFLTVLFPLLAMNIASEFGPDVPVVVQMFAVALGYLVGAIAVWFASRRHGRLVELLRADITSSLNNYLGVPASVTNRLDVNQHLSSLRNQLASWTDALREGMQLPNFSMPGMGHSAEGKTMASVLPDTPQAALATAITAGSAVVPKTPLNTVVISSGNDGQSTTLVSMAGSKFQDGAGHGDSKTDLNAPGDDTQAVTQPSASPTPWRLPDLTAAVLPGAGGPGVLSLPGASAGTGAGPAAPGTGLAAPASGVSSVPGPVGVPNAAAPVVDPAQEALRRFREGRSLLSTAQGSTLREGATGSAVNTLANITQSPLPQSVLTRVSADPFSGRSLIRTGATTGTLPSITAYGDMMSTLNGVSRLAKARGQRIAINLPDNDPAFGVRFNDDGPRVSSAMDFGFGDLI